ncbi:antibiotic biosynthesis monooxygenase family protein [Nocardia wallacei]|uniref:antibiotic biosynthesis monooxygenase family protein n=1 Tax=Nocardia wallacei TaxID=480035 RepID=UPI002454AC2A|nr:antibiotic biosynthesis monooxygenase [Nocardia wallacei]
MTSAHGADRSLPSTAVANCISAPAAFSPWIKESFAATLTTLEAVSGIRGFRLCRLAGIAEHCLFVSITVWDNIGHFERWRRSEAFTQAHPDRTRHQKQFERMQTVRYDIELDASVRPGDIDTEILHRLSADCPELVPIGAVLMNEIAWTPSGSEPFHRSWADTTEAEVRP